MFRAGTTLSYTNSKFKRAVAKPLAFEIASIDLASQKAELVTSKGRGEVKIVRALNANHFGNMGNPSTPIAISEDWAWRKLCTTALSAEKSMAGSV